MNDLFVKLMKFTGEKEDFFTECVAATLKADERLCKGFLAAPCGEEVDGVSVRDTGVSVETQQKYVESRVDMVFRVGPDKTIGVENKLWAAEGEGQLSK